MLAFCLHAGLFANNQGITVYSSVPSRLSDEQTVRARRNVLAEAATKNRTTQRCRESSGSKPAPRTKKTPDPEVISTIKGHAKHVVRNEFKKRPRRTDKQGLVVRLASEGASLGKHDTRNSL